jgi:hypothetical protein
MVNKVDILINRWQQHRGFALQQKGAQDWLVANSGGRKRGLLSSVFQPPAVGCCNAELGCCSLGEETVQQTTLRCSHTL